MKILILNDVAAPHGGAELMTLALRAGLRARGHDARIFASTAHLEPGSEPADYSCFGTTSALRSLNRAVNLSAAVRLRQCLQAFKPDVVHMRSFLSQLSPMVLPFLNDTPVLYHATWNEMVCPTGLKLLPDRSVCRQRPGMVCRRSGCLSVRAWGPLIAQNKLARRGSRHFDLIVANSESMKQRLLADGFGPVEVVHNGVPLAAERDSMSAEPTVTYAGRISPEKGVDVLLDAFAQIAASLPRARLLIAGRGPEVNALKQKAGDLGLQNSVHWLGHLPHAQLDRVLQSAWVHVVPSLCEEGFGQTAAEASMRGVAVVASNSGGLAEIVQHEETGLLTRPGNKDELAHALQRLLNDRSMASALGKAGRVRVASQMSMEQWLDRFELFYSRLANGNDGKTD